MLIRANKIQLHFADFIFDIVEYYKKKFYLQNFQNLSKCKKILPSFFLLSLTFLGKKNMKDDDIVQKGQILFLTVFIKSSPLCTDYNYNYKYACLDICHF